MRRLARLLDGDVKVFLLASNTRATSPGGCGGKVKEEGVRSGCLMGMVVSEVYRSVGELAQGGIRCGYKRVHILQRRQVICVNKKDVHRLVCEEGLQIQKRRGWRKPSRMRIGAPSNAMAALTPSWIRSTKPKPRRGCFRRRFRYFRCWLPAVMPAGSAAVSF